MGVRNYMRTKLCARGNPLVQEFFNQFRQILSGFQIFEDTARYFLGTLSQEDVRGLKLRVAAFPGRAPPAAHKRRHRWIRKRRRLALFLRLGLMPEFSQRSELAGLLRHSKSPFLL